MSAGEGGRARVAVVTGASSGIGRAIAEALGGRALHVVLVGRDEVRLAGTAASVHDAGGTAEIAPTDLADDAACRSLGRMLARRHERLDVLVHAAGVAVAAPAFAGALDDDRDDPPPNERFAEQMAVNVHAPMLLTAALLASLERAAGLVVVVNSSAATRSTPGVSGYAASKAALRSWTDTLRDELSGRDVRVCSVFPGRTATPMQRALHESGDRGEYRPALLLQPDDVARVVGFVVDQPPHVELTDVSLRPARRSY